MLIIMKYQWFMFTLKNKSLVDECRQRNCWPKMNEVIQAELKFLVKRKVFSLVIETLKVVKLVWYKWVFVRKWNVKNKVIRNKARLVAQGFS